MTDDESVFWREMLCVRGSLFCRISFALQKAAKHCWLSRHWRWRWLKRWRRIAEDVPGEFSIFVKVPQTVSLRYFLIFIDLDPAFLETRSARSVFREKLGPKAPPLSDPTGMGNMSMGDMASIRRIRGQGGGQHSFRKQRNLDVTVVEVDLRSSYQIFLSISNW